MPPNQTSVGSASPCIVVDQVSVGSVRGVRAFLPPDVGVQCPSPFYPCQVNLACARGGDKGIRLVWLRQESVLTAIPRTICVDGIPPEVVQFALGQQRQIVGVSPSPKTANLVPVIGVGGTSIRVPLHAPSGGICSIASE